MLAYCPKCGATVEPNAQFCPSCGSQVNVSSQSDSPQTPPPSWSPPSIPGQRPVGVTILAILAIIGGIAALLGSVGMFALASYSNGFISGGAALALGGYLIIVALLAFATAYGFWTGARWGWWLGIILGVLDVLAILQGLQGVFGLIIGLLILYYLTRPHVKVWFRKA